MRFSYSSTGFRTGVLAALVLLSILPAAAQQAIVQGVVSDPSNSMIPGAQVKVTNTATGTTQSSMTNEQGFYSIPFLTPGTYKVEAGASGFATASIESLKLDVNQTARIDLTLKVGTVAETVEISAAAALIDAETSSVGQVIDNKRIVELPLNGRNYLDLARLTTGVTPDSGSRTTSKGSFSALGQHAYQTNVMLDGVDNNSRASGGQLGFEAQAVTPSIDAVQEFKVITNNNSAEYGFRMGGTVLVQTKSGSNDFHGTTYEFLRNEKLDGTNFFSVGRPKPPYRRNQFGATMGGRIIRDKTFFFGSYEGTRVRQGLTSITTLPTDAMRSGDFSGQRIIYDPATTRQVNGVWTRDPLPGNRVPTTMMDPVAVKVAALYPTPNLPGLASNNYFSGSSIDDTNQVDGRLDHTFTAKHRMFVRYSRRGYNSVAPGGLPLPADGGNWTTTQLTSNNVVGNWNSTLTPTINNEFRVGYSTTQSVLDIPWTDNYNEKLGIQGLADLGDDNQRGMTRFTPAGYAEVGARSFWPNRNNLDFLQVSDHVLKVQGRHVLKAGFEFRREQLFRRAARYSRGQMSFDGSFTQNPSDRGRTGNGFADLLLGFASGGNLGNQNGEEAVALNQSAYLQDDWRVSSKLTVNLGVRWDRFGPPSFRDSKVGRFEFAYGDPGYRIIRPTGDGDCGCEPDNNNFAPRIGLAYQMNSKTVVRTGFGMYYGQPDAIAHDGDARFYNQAPDFAEIGFPTDRLLQPSLIVKDGFPAGLVPSPDVKENNAVRTALAFMPAQYSMQWFTDVQRELPAQTVLTVSYIGLNARHLVITRNINQPLTPRAGAIKANRPWPFFGGITLRDPSATSSYQALGAKVEKRYSAGVTFLASYTWSHAIDVGAGTLDDGTAGGGIRDNYNLNSNRGNSAYDVRHNFIFSGVYDLPIGKGRSYMNHGGPIDWVLGGWQIGGILGLRSGRPFSPFVNGDLSNTGTQNYPNRVGSGVAADANIDRWFDLAAFTVPAQYTYGNSGRNILFGPGYANVDFKVGKSFSFKERYRVEFRCEMFNATNTPYFGLPNSTVNLPAGGQIRSAGDPRDIQFGLKFVY